MVLDLLGYRLFGSVGRALLPFVLGMGMMGQMVIDGCCGCNRPERDPLLTTGRGFDSRLLHHTGEEVGV